MSGQTKYFISNTNGFFVNWYSDITGLESHGQALKVSGNGGDDAVYVGQGTKVDATGLTSTGGSDSIYLTGTFNDYAQTLDGSTYTFKRTVNIGGTDYQEEVSFTASDGDKVYFANGFVKIDITGTDGLLNAGVFQKIKFADIVSSSITLTDPLTSQPAIDKGTASEVGATKVFISDNNGEHITSGVKGSVFKIFGNGGNDTVYVAKGTKVDATGLTSTGGNDVIYLTGTFNEYTKQTVDDNTYTFERTVNINGTEYQEEVSFTGSNGDRVYFADGFVKIDITGNDKLLDLNTGAFKRIISTDIDGSESTLGLGIGLSITDDLAETSIINKAKVGTDITYTFTFENDVTGFDKNDIEVTGGTKGAFSGSGSVYSLVVRVTDNSTTDLFVGVAKDAAIGGSIGTEYASNSHKVDTVVPSKPISLDLATEDDSGTSNSDNLTNKTSNLTITGSAEVGATIRLYNGTNTTAIGSEIVKANGTFSIDISLIQSTIPHSITARATDAAGNESAVSDALAITVDTTAPTATVATATTNIGTDVSVQSSETGTAYLVLKSIADTYADVDSTSEIEDLVGNTWNKVTIATANSATNISTAGLTAGEYVLLTADAAGNVSTATTEVVTVNTAPILAKASGSDDGSLFGQTITITDATYDGLKLDFTTAVQGLFAVDSSSAKISLSSDGKSVLYDADGAGSTDTAVIVGTLNGVAIPTFTEVIGLNVTGNTLTKNSGTNGWSNGDSFSTTAITADGFVSAQAGQTNVNLMFGLSNSNTGDPANYKDLDYAIYLGGSIIGVYEKGMDRGGQLNSYTTSDVFSVVRTGDTITYLKNGILFYTSEIKTTAPLYLETAFSTNNASLTNILVDNGTTTGHLNITFNSNATQDAINAITNAVTYTGKEAEVKLKATDAGGLSSELSVTVTDNLAPTATVATATANIGTNVSVQSSETGTAYLVLKSIADTYADVDSTSEIEDLVGNTWNKVTIATANSATNISTAGLTAGEYVLLTADAAGNVSTATTEVVTVNTAPILAKASGSDDGSLFGQTITITDATYDGLKLDFTTAVQGLFAVDSSSAKISLSSDGKSVLYDADGAGSTDTAVIVGTLNGVAIPTFTEVIGLNVTGNTLTKNSGTNGWSNGDSFSTTAITADGFVSAQAGQTNGNLMFGLSNSNTGDPANYKDLDYAIYFDGGIKVYEKGAYRNQYFSSYTTSDVFSVVRTGDTITYLKNGILFYTSEIKTTAPLYLETAFSTNNASLTNIVLNNSALDITFNNNATQDAVNAITNAVTYTGNEAEIKLKATDAGSLSSSELSVTATDNLAPTATVATATTNIGTNVSVQSSETGTAYLVLKSIADTYADVDSTSEIEDLVGNTWNKVTIATANSATNISTAGLTAGEYVLLTADAAGNVSTATTEVVTVNTAPILAKASGSDDGSLFGQTITITDATYDGLKLDFTTAVQGSFAVDSSSAKISLSSDGKSVLYDADGAGSTDTAVIVGTLNGVAIPTFTEVIGLNVTGNTLTKNSGTNGWSNGDSFSTTAITADGFVSAQAGQTNVNLMFGLSNSNTGDPANYKDLDYAIYLGGSIIGVYEKGMDRGGQLNSYTTSDVFSVVRTGDTITYLKNGILFYTSEIKTTELLYLETAFSTNNASLTNILVDNGTTTGHLNITFNSNATQDAINAITNAVTYTGNEAEIKLKATDAGGLSSELSVTATVTTTTHTVLESDTTATAIPGIDTFVYGAGTTTGFGTDTISGFEKGVDKLNLADLLTGADRAADLAMVVAIASKVDGTVSGTAAENTSTKITIAAENTASSSETVIILTDVGFNTDLNTTLGTDNLILS